MKKFFSRVFSKTFLTVLLLLIQIVIIVGLFTFLESYWWVTLILQFLSLIVAFVIVNSRCDGAYKISWLFFIVFIPVFGTLCYILFANKKITKREFKKSLPMVKAINAANKVVSPKPLLTADKDPMAYSNSVYLAKYSQTPLFDNSKATYFSWGEDAFPVMLEKIKAAKHYIFMEYFIISSGKMWDSILEVLKQKAEEGLDVRLLYDDFGCLTTLPNHYYKELRKYGIKAYAVNKIKPLVNIRMNNRDHRKILVIDGHTGFTGGINLADEYINQKVRFGIWKDNAIMIEGEAVFGLTSLFLSTWHKVANEEELPDFKEYLPEKYEEEAPKFKAEGYVQPYGSIPFTFETVGANVYLNLLAKANKYVYIATPYLILNEEMQNAICQCAKNGVKVKLLTPHIPDKKMVFQLTRSYYKPLVMAGVEIYEYKPGFVHEKMFLVDDIIGTVGTINLDYRSLFLHMENGIFLYKNECLQDIKNDFEESFKVGIKFDLAKIESTNPMVKLWRCILRVIAPLV